MFVEVRLLWVALVLRFFFRGPIGCTSGWRALGFGTPTVLVVMVVDESRSEYERICLDMAEAATKGLRFGHQMLMGLCEYVNRQETGPAVKVMISYTTPCNDALREGRRKCIGEKIRRIRRHARETEDSIVCT